MKIFAFIFARGGSKGLPGKNIKDLCGKPLIAHSIEQARKLKNISEVFVSTEDEAIAKIAKKHGAQIIKRPKELAEDHSPEYQAWKHAINYLFRKNITFDCFLSLPATAPLRSKEDIINVLNLLDEKTDFVVTATESERNPFFNMLEVDKKGFAKIFCKSDQKYIRRQDVPKAYDMTTVAYAAKPQTLLQYNHIFDSRVKILKIPKERALDIDTSFDFTLAQLLMENKLNA